jgi:uncharacterized protein
MPYRHACRQAVPFSCVQRQQMNERQKHVARCRNFRWMSAALALIPVLAALGACSEVRPDPAPVYSLLEARHARTVVQQWDISCGAAALATLLTYQHGDKVSEREVAAGMLRTVSAAVVRRRLGFSLLDLKRFARSRGFEADGYGNMTTADLASSSPMIVPIITLRGLPHFVVFRGVVGDRVLLSDPGFGNRTLTVEQFEAVWKSKVGFSVRRVDGKPPPNQLAPKPEDFWASSRREPSALEILSRGAPHS